MKKGLAALMVAAMAASVAAVPVMADDVSISIFNSKMEIDAQLKEMAEKYYEETGVKVDVNYSSDTVAAHMATRYSSGEPYTISMVDAKDIYSLGPDHAVDLSDEDWVKDTTQAISIDGKVLGFPVCVEARGVIYNKTAIEEVTGEEFNPADYVSRAAFEELIQKLIDGGMETPTGVMKEDWSLAAHFLAEAYETREDVDG
ncbi:MAG: extracellular solute-binding protein, partial [Eubacteriales bacterium]|nr:extracellular solute-binding protein [Eubacteriales bacterium]